MQGRRWAGRIKVKMSPKGHPYDESTYDSGATFRSYGAEFGDREGEGGLWVGTGWWSRGAPHQSNVAEHRTKAPWKDRRMKAP